MATSTMSKSKVETGAPVSGNPTMMDKLSNYIIVDIGANLTNKKFSRDLDQVIQRATDAGKKGCEENSKCCRRKSSTGVIWPIYFERFF